MVPKNHGSSKMVVKFHGSHNLHFWQICASESLNLLYSYLLLVQLYLLVHILVGGAVISWLVPLSLDRAVQV